MKFKNNKWFIIPGLLIAGIIAGNLLANDPDYRLGIAILIFIGGLWVTEAVPLAVSGLLVPVIAVLFKIFNAKEALAHFANPVIFIFVGGFALAAVLNEHGIDRWLANKLIHLAGGRRWIAIASILAATSFFSMWMSNTATAAMFLPIGMSLIDKKYPRARTYVILGIAFSASIGGIGTMIGSPPNLIAAAAIGVDFATWFKFGLPVAVVLFPLLLFVLKLVIRPEKNFCLNELETAIDKWTGKQTGATVYFFLIVIFWIGSKPIGDLMKIDNFDSVVGVAAASLAPVFGLITWNKLQSSINWGILLLFGGGLCLSAVLSSTGTSEMIATSILRNVHEGQGLLLILLATAFIICLTEISSNTGAAAITVPIMMEVAVQFNPGYVLPMVMAIGIGANCAFMLPVSTPPNALVYATNEVTVKTMIKAGVLLDLLAIPVIWFWVSKGLIF
jgi:sodium-dependent dicarboxylate transporter 2/3/5